MSTADDAFVLDVSDDPVVTDPRDDIPATPVDEGPKTLEEARAALEKAQAKAGQYAAERDIALKGLDRPVAPPPMAVPPAPDSTAQRAQFEGFLENLGQKQLMGDYKGATVDLLNFVDHLVNEKVKASQVPVSSATARQAVRNFESSMRDDPYYPKAADAFRANVEKALPAISQMPPDQQDQAIDLVYNMTAGQVARAQARNGRAEVPPAYATGSASSGARPSARQRTLTAMQRQYVLSAREAKIPEDRIRQVLDSMDETT